MKNKFDHKIDKESIPVCNIMGVNIAAINMDWLLRFTHAHIKDLSGDYMCISNVHTTVMAYEDETYRAIQNNGILCAPDGGPLSVVGRRRGFRQMTRTTGPDYMDEVFKVSQDKGYRHYFYGATEETLKKLGLRLKEQYSGVKIVGMYSPPFRPMNDEEDAIIIEQINKVKPDFVWVGLGAPKQEIWMANHQGRISGFMVGVGAGFDYFAENISRAPKWMQKSNLEWLYRLMQDPRRLFKRYLLTNTKFIWSAVIRGK